MKRSTVLALTALTLLGGCKTAEDIDRERKVDEMALQMTSNSKMTAELTQRMQNLEQRISLMTGQFEESTHTKQQQINAQMEKLSQNIALMEEKLANSSESLNKANEQLKNQGQFIEKITSSITEASGKPGKKGKKGKKGNEATDVSTPEAILDQAMANYNAKKYDEAYDELQAVIKKKGLPGAGMARALNALGMIEFSRKNNEDASVFFSQVYTKYPKSSEAKNSLYQLGLIFKSQGKAEEARDILTELVTKYPDAPQAKKAEKILNNMK